MLAVDNISKSFATQTLFKNTSFSVGDQARIGVVGPNGAGKSTFFRILVGEDRVDKGEIRFPKNYRVALMRQEWVPQQGDDLITACLRQHQDWFTSWNELQVMNKKLAENPSEENISRYQIIEERFTAMGGYGLQQTAQDYLIGLGFADVQMNRPAGRV